MNQQLTLGNRIRSTDCIRPSLQEFIRLISPKIGMSAANWILDICDGLGLQSYKKEFPGRASKRFGIHCLQWSLSRELSETNPL
jgi:hypothetical protein